MKIIKEIETNILTVNEDWSAMIKKKQEELDLKQYQELFTRITLYVTDMLWMQHLQVMDYTRQSVNLRAYGQRDPLVEYKKEGLRLYQEMGDAFTSKVAELFAHVELRKQSATATQGESDTPVLAKKDDNVEIMKNGEVRRVKKKKLDDFIAAGWETRKK
jgi:preprotein translocase subunit SecA